ncbi:head-tail connector protein [Salipiger manganoxidans]|uniref:head-tail connector protein n=1 Tax=Salipiger marinus TaxID=555512 RepID=UPI001E4B7B31|nr:head-tail connector protein [Salipiger manganoxidans]MCD1620958.1 head-tail connector protein [Salipiger manganoxidans]
MIVPVRTVAPVNMPVSLAEAKAHLRVDHDDQDDLITAQIKAATAYLDGYAGILGRALVTQTWRHDFAGFADRLALPVSPVTAIVSVSYFDVGNVVQTLDPSVCDLFTDARGAYVSLRPGQSWPATFYRPDAVSVTFTAGFGAADVPEPIRQAILLIVQRLFDGTDTSIDVAIDRTVHALIAPYRRSPI